MPLLRCSAVLFCLLGFICPRSPGQNQDTNFPTDEEIRLLIGQADRAIQQYKPLLDIEEKTLGTKGEAAVAKDRQVIEGLEMAIKAFGKNPQGFNGPLGFAFFEWLDDADRNALLCASNSATEAIVNMLAGEKDKAETEIHLSNGCLDASTLIYTVSENAGALYTRYVEGEEKLAKEGLQFAEECAAALKQKRTAPKK
jgi:hypothetical protein